jgi:hypothetical protein
MAAGANQMGGVRLELSPENASVLRAQAREKAVADARAQAEQLAKLSGARLGAVLSVSTASADGPYPMAMAKAVEDSSGGVPVEPGTLIVTERVEMRFEIAR